MRYVSIDMESCGLVSEECDILEFGAVIDDLSSALPVDSLPVFHCYFVKEYYKGQPYALSMHPKIFRRIAEREAGYNYYQANKFSYYFKKFLMSNGYNEIDNRVIINVAGKNFGACDLQFLKNQTDINKHVKIRHRIIDPGTMYMRQDDDSIPGLEECLRRAELEPNVEHESVPDAKDVIKLIRKHYGLPI